MRSDDNFIEMCFGIPLIILLSSSSSLKSELFKRILHVVVRNNVNVDFIHECFIRTVRFLIYRRAENRSCIVPRLKPRGKLRVPEF